MLSTVQYSTALNNVQCMELVSLAGIPNDGIGIIHLT